MSAKHTPGPLEAYTRGMSVPAIREAGRQSAPDGGHIASFASYRDTNEAATIRDRMLQCWNACEGMDDPAAEIARLRAERDGLARHLDDLRTALRDSRFRFDVKKDFSLMVADSEAGKMLHKLAGGEA